MSHTASYQKFIYYHNILIYLRISCLNAVFLRVSKLYHNCSHTVNEICGFLSKFFSIYFLLIFCCKQYRFTIMCFSKHIIALCCQNIIIYNNFRQYFHGYTPNPKTRGFTAIKYCKVNYFTYNFNCVLI